LHIICWTHWFTSRCSMEGKSVSSCFSIVCRVILCFFERRYCLVSLLDTLTSLRSACWNRCVRMSVREFQLYNRGTDFYEILYWRIVRKLVDFLQFTFRLDHFEAHLTGDPPAFLWTCAFTSLFCACAFTLPLCTWAHITTSLQWSVIDYNAFSRIPAFHTTSGCSHVVRVGKTTTNGSTRFVGERTRKSWISVPIAVTLMKPVWCRGYECVLFYFRPSIYFNYVVTFGSGFLLYLQEFEILNSGIVF
jgi:hypothetical protein